MVKIIFLVVFFVFNIFSFGYSNDRESFSRENLANRNLEILFNKNIQDNQGQDKEFMDILQKYIFGEVFYVGDLDIKLRELLTISVLTTLQTLTQLKGHINAALDAGCKPIEIREVIYNLAPMIGFPKVLNAIYVFNDVIDKRNLTKDLKDLSKVNERNRYKKGSKIERSLYGDEAFEEFKNLPNNMGKDVSKFLTSVRFGDFYTREGIDIKTRELTSMVSLVALGNYIELKSHINGSLKAGNSIENIIASIIQVMPYIGFPNTFVSLKLAKKVIEESNLQSHESFTPLFGIGYENESYSKYFKGKSYLKVLSKEQVNIVNVTFEPKTRNNWHIHNGGGQILLVTDGRGYYQEWGKLPIELKKGDVVNIAPGVKHWHGAAPDSWFSHIAIEVPNKNYFTEWLEPVSDKEYKKLQ